MLAQQVSAVLVKARSSDGALLHTITELIEPSGSALDERFTTF